MLAGFIFFVGSAFPAESKSCIKLQPVKLLHVIENFEMAQPDQLSFITLGNTDRWALFDVASAGMRPPTSDCSSWTCPRPSDSAATCVPDSLPSLNEAFRL